MNRKDDATVKLLPKVRTQDAERDDAPQDPAIGPCAS